MLSTGLVLGASLGYLLLLAAVSAWLLWAGRLSL